MIAYVLKNQIYLFLELPNSGGGWKRIHGRCVPSHVGIYLHKH